MFTESLTVRILGDSSDLQRELESVVSQLDEFQTRLSEAGASSRELSEGLQGVGAAGAPLRQLSSQLAGVQRQAQQLSGQTIALNVQPALASLAQLSGAIQRVAAQLAQLGAMSATPAIGGGGTARPGRMPTGFDAAPAFFTAGEVVLNHDSTQRLGTTFLTALHRGTAGSASQTRSLPETNVPVSTTNNHFGGITVNVAEAGGVNEVIRDLRLQGAALRVRRG
ncbi:hypothetical protein Pan44_01710 [Caulifigura coniformis]|uniref:Uncharacterized protein n=1 Tax=Caulifigura coniformis TaxID=2527983 RepID=A0A517S7Q7_9PLAN|nr:hypothetical protein [Caulifigura coniformis]QDT52162.1 hypothetical protein Pan44_01710 [Caulifigura coniformis]